MSLAPRLEGREEPATTVVNLFGLFLGAFKYREAKANLTAVKGLSSTLRILSFTGEASELAARTLCGLEKVGRGIEIRDFLVGATASKKTTPGQSRTRNTSNEYHASQSELAIRLQDNGIHYQTQVEIPITTADFYFPLESRPLLVFVDGRVHLGTAQMTKDEELRSLLRKRGYRILELYYNNYSDRKKDQLYEEIRDNLAGLTC